jgi:hypothetical protein
MTTLRFSCSSVLASLSIVLLVLGSLVHTQTALADELLLPVCTFAADCPDQNGSGHCDGGCGSWNSCYCECDFDDADQCACYIIPESC